MAEFVRNLVFWKRPVLSGLVLGIGILFFWLVDHGHSFLSLISYSLLLVLSMVACYTKMLALYVRLSSRRDDPFPVPPNKIYLPPKVAKYIALDCARAINTLLNSLFVNAGSSRSLSLAVCLCVLGWLGQRLSDRAVVLGLFLLTMTVPPLYQLNSYVRKGS